MADPIFSPEEIAVMRAEARGLPAGRRDPIRMPTDGVVERSLDGVPVAATAVVPLEQSQGEEATEGDKGRRIAALVEAVRSAPGGEDGAGEVVPFHDDAAAGEASAAPAREDLGEEAGEELDIDDVEEVTPEAESAAPLLHPPLPAAPPDWFETIFDDDYLRVMPAVDHEQLGRDLRFVLDGLAVAPGAKLLDLGCGPGLHAIELQARGFDMVGLDSSLVMLTHATEEARRRGLGPSFVHGDMRALSLDGEFEGALCIHGTFGYFEDDENAQVLANVHQALKPGARFVLGVPNRDYFVADLPARICWEAGGCMVLEEVDFDFVKSRLEVRRSIAFEDGRQVEHRYSLRAYGLHELARMLAQGGFRVLSVSGHIATPGTFLGPYSRSILLVAQKL
jgi:SAM-dependent methyltransferase